jgi:hypothetical protein
MHITSLLGLLKEFQGQNLQNFVPSAYAFGRRPNFFKFDLRLRPNVKNMASVILCLELETYDHTISNGNFKLSGTNTYP